MEVVNKQRSRHKAFAITSIMKNPGLAQIMFDAWDAPVGSTKKTRARSILKSLEKSQKNFSVLNDGRGGTENPYQINPFSNLQGSIYGSMPNSTPALPKNIPTSNLTVGSTGPTTLDTSKMSPGNPFATAPLDFNTPMPEVPAYPTGVNTNTGTSTGTTTGAIGADQNQYDSGEQYYNPNDLAQAAADDMLLQSMTQLYNMGNIPTIKDWYDSLDSSMQDYYKEVFEAVNNNQSPSAFLNEVLMTRDLLSKYTGMDKASLDKIFPADTGMLYPQLIDIRDAIVKEHNLEGMRNQLTQLISRGYTIEKDIDFYIRGKDEYLGKIDSLIDKYKEKAAYMDTSNPYVAERLQNYGNYLTILKGRQTMRYQDLLDYGLRYHEAKVNDLKSLYESEYSKATQEVQDQQAMTSEAYEKISTSINDLYSYVAGREKSAQENQKYQMEQIKSVGDILNTFYDTQKVKKETEESAANADYMWKVGELDDITKNILGFDSNTADGVTTYTMNNKNPIDALNQALALGKEAGTVLNQYQQTALANLNSKIGSAEFSNEFNQYLKILNSLEQEDYSNLPAEEAARNILSSVIASSLGSYLNRSLSGSTRVPPKGLKDLINELTGRGMFNTREGVDAREDLLKEYSDLGDIGRAVIDYYFKQVSTGTVEPDEAFTTGHGEYMPDMDDDGFMTALNQKLYSYILETSL